MVDRADLERANRLAGEATQIERALEHPEAGGSIMSVTVAGPPPAPPPGSGPPTMPSPASTMPVAVMISASSDELLAEVKATLEVRKAGIDSELAELGVRG